MYKRGETTAGDLFANLHQLIHFDMNHPERKPLFSEFPPVPTEAWEDRIKADLKGADYEKKLIWKTPEGINVRPYYRSEDLAGLEFCQTGAGSYPYLRADSGEPTSWLVRQDIQPTNLSEAGRLAADAVRRGAGSVGVKANLVTTHRELSELLSGIDFGKTAVNFISAQSYPLTLEFLVYELNHRGIGGERMQGSVNFDPLSYLLLHGDFYISWENDLEEAKYLLGIVREKLPQFRSITINGHYFQDAGSTLVEELAYSLASASEYFSGLTDAGFTADEIAPHVQFSLAIGPNYFLEIAKLRAARLLWRQLVRAYGAKEERSFKLFIHATTARWNKSLYDPYVNMLRTTTESMSAILGNADSVTTLPFDVRSAEPDEFARRIARNQQLVLKEEAYLDKIADPAAGSYYIENLTNSIARHAWDLFVETEAAGGMLASIQAGSVQERIAASRKQKEEEIAQRRLIVLGTNQFPNPGEAFPAEVQPIREREEKATTFRKLTPFRVAAPFEEIRLATDRYVASGHPRPSVFLLTMGNLAMLRARAGFTTNFFGCAGYDIIDNPGFASPAEGVDAALASGARIVVICSSDDEYPSIVPEIAAGLKAAAPDVRLIVAGFPKDHIESFRAAGVDDFIHVRTNLLETLTKYQRMLTIGI